MRQNTGALLTHKVTYVTLEELQLFCPTPMVKLTCAIAMQVAAKKAAKEKIVIIQFKHPDPPRFYEKTEYGNVITLVNADAIKIPTGLIHLGKGVIGHNYAKVKPNYIETLTALKKASEKKN